VLTVLLLLQAVILDFIDFSTETSVDIVYIYDGWNASAMLIAAISGLLSTPPKGYIYFTALHAGSILDELLLCLTRFSSNFHDVEYNWLVDLAKLYPSEFEIKKLSKMMSVYIYMTLYILLMKEEQQNVNLDCFYGKQQTLQNEIFML
jgi:hypothetical protein